MMSQLSAQTVYERLLESSQPVLVTVDYVEDRTEQLVRLLVLILIFRPAGILGRSDTQKV